MDRNPLIAVGAHVPQALLTQRARELAAGGLGTDAIEAALASDYTGLPAFAHFGNPAALAVMERIRAGQKEAARQAAHNTWRASKGMPEIGAEEEEQPEPSGEELAAISSGADLLKLCRRHGIQIAYDDAAGKLRPSRPIDMEGPLAAAIRRYRSSLIKLQSATKAAP